jgi:hypothetical protein
MSQASWECNVIEEFMKKCLGIILIVLFSGNIYASPEIKGNPEELQSYFHPTEKTISIRGEAEETAYTDIAIVNLVVRTKDKLLSKAISLNSELRNKIRGELVKSGVDDSLIKNSKFSSSPQYGWFGSEPDSYEVLNRVAIKISTGNQLESIAYLADSYNEVTLSGTTFEHSKKMEFEKIVKEKALNKILEKKKFYENSLGIRLTAVSFSESEVGSNGTQGANYLKKVVVTGAGSSKGNYSQKPAYSSVGENSFDEIKYRSVVTVEFKVN